VGKKCTFFFRPVCVREVSQVGAEQVSMALQVVILEWLGTAAKLAVHLAQVSQVGTFSESAETGHPEVDFANP
jgi:hypothetical protein